MGNSLVMLEEVAILRCPITREALTALSADELQTANQAFQSRERVHRDGTPVEAFLTEAIGNESRSCLYRVAEGIYWLLPDLALVPKTGVVARVLGADKLVVQTFYDEFGWVKSSEGIFNDTAVFTDTRDTARNYQRSCNRRIGKFLGKGTYLLDVASGAIPLPEYLDLSRDYEKRVCIDFSIRALREARAKLGTRGLYILGDITCLPLVDNIMDSAISLHTIYHVPQDEQTTAVDELIRVVRPRGRAIIVYTWSTSALMNSFSRLRHSWAWVLGLFGGQGRGQTHAATALRASMPPLYFRPQGYAWFASEIKPRYPVRLMAWSAVSNSFQRSYFGNRRVGRALCSAILVMERMLPHISGRYGQFPMFVIDKPEL